MALQKGFLQPPDGVIKCKRILPGILLGLNLALVIYAFCVGLREVLRIISDYQVFVVLSPKEVWFYNIFYATVASIVGCSFALRYMIEGSLQWENAKVKFSQRLAVYPYYSYTWFALYWLASTFFLIGIWYITVPLYFYLDLSTEYPWVFVLFASVWYLNLWLNTHRILGRKRYKWMGLGVLIIAVNVALITQIDLVDSEAVNQVVLKKRIEFKYQIERPKVLSYQYHIRPDRDLALPVYVVFAKDQAIGPPQIVVRNNFTQELQRIELSDFQDCLREQQDRIDEIERDRFAVWLHIDTQVPMHMVNQIKEVIRKSGVRMVNLAVRPTHDTNPHYNPEFEHMHFPQILSVPCLEVKQYVDSLRNLGYPARQVRFSDHRCYIVAHLENYNRVLLKVTADQRLYLNGASVDSTQLGVFIKGLFQKYKDKALVLLDNIWPPWI